MSDAPGSSSGRFKSPTLPCTSTTKRPRKMKYRPCQKKRWRAMLKGLCVLCEGQGAPDIGRNIEDTEDSNKYTY